MRVDQSVIRVHTYLKSAKSAKSASPNKKRTGLVFQRSAPSSRGMTAVVGFDFRFSADKVDGYLAAIPVIKSIFKKWTFQLEEGDSGYIHYQGRGFLFKKKPLALAINQFAGPLFNAHLSITSSLVHAKQCFCYVMKLDSRIAGPWSDIDEEFVDPPPLTRQLIDFHKCELYPWQASLLQLIERRDDRYITCVVEPAGNNGKSILCEHMEYKALAYEIPGMYCMEDIMQCCMSIPEQKCYLIDMPRAMRKDKLGPFYSGLECLKNGVMYDKRYAFKKRRIDRPQVVVFTNVAPQTHYLSADRWDFYYIDPFTRNLEKGLPP